MVFSEVSKSNLLEVKEQAKDEMSLISDYIENLRACSLFSDFDLVSFNGDKNEILRKINLLRETYRFFLDKDFIKYIGHDAKGIIATCSTALFRLQRKNLDDKDSWEQLNKHWQRFSIVIEDVLIRTSELEDRHIVPEIFQHTFDIGDLKRILDYFQSVELERLKKEDAYSGIENRRFIINVNFEQIEENFKNKKIRGNFAVIANFILNALRNSLKSAIEASKVEISMYVVDNEFVIEIFDNGKGMSSEHLDSKDAKFIFRSGSSSTGSSGIGLTHLNSRISSMGGKLQILSKRKEELDTIGTTPFIYYKNFDGKDESFDFMNGQDLVGIMDSKIRVHGTEIKIYLPLE